MAESILGCGGTCLRRAMQLLPRQKAAFDATSLFRNPSSNATLSFTTAAATASESVAPQDVTAAIIDAPNTQLPDEPTISKRKADERLQRIVKKQLEYMDDPWKIAQQVEKLLKKGQFEEAKLMTQIASRDAQCVVSWNHLIDYALRNNQLKVGIKLYNDMKKRAQLPNVQTYTIMFRGLAHSEHPKLAVSEAIKHYNILMRDQRIQPNSIHLNAVLNVCARAGDLDSMFSIVDTANASTRAPTTYTYTTIINAMRHQTIKDIKDLTPEQANENMGKMIARAKAIWEEVISKWRSGALMIDEELVCAMSRVILLEPERRDKRQVLDLIEQTMGIPNMSKDDNSSFSSTSPEEFVTKGELDASKPSPSKSAAASRRPKYNLAVPGPNTLAVILTVLASARLTTCGIKYWNYLLRNHSVVPDNDNWLRMFGMLKVARASAHASALVDSVPTEFIDAKHYRIAMETCVRDNINQNAIRNADRVLDSIARRLPIPDCHTMRLYLRVALVSHSSFRKHSEDGHLDAAKRDYGIQITQALSRLWEPFTQTHAHYFSPSSPSAHHRVVARPKGSSKPEGILYNDKREVIALARNMYSAFSKVIEENMIPEADLIEIRPLGALINREIQNFYSNREELEPNLRKNNNNSSRTSSYSSFSSSTTSPRRGDRYQKEAPEEKRESVATDSNMDDGTMEGSQFEYRPAGDFIWNTKKSAEQQQEREERRRNYEPSHNSPRNFERGSSRGRGSSREGYSSLGGYSSRGGGSSRGRGSSRERLNSRRG